MSSNPMPSTPAGPGLKWELVPVVRNGQTFSRWTQVRDGASSAGAANSAAMAGVVPEYDDEDDEEPFEDMDDDELQEALDETNHWYAEALVSDAAHNALESGGILNEYGELVQSAGDVVDMSEINIYDTDGLGDGGAFVEGIVQGDDLETKEALEKFVKAHGWDEVGSNFYLSSAGHGAGFFDSAPDKEVGLTQEHLDILQDHARTYSPEDIDLEAVTGLCNLGERKMALDDYYENEGHEVAELPDYSNSESEYPGVDAALRAHNVSIGAKIYPERNTPVPGSNFGFDGAKFTPMVVTFTNDRGRSVEIPFHVGSAVDPYNVKPQEVLDSVYSSRMEGSVQEVADEYGMDIEDTRARADLIYSMHVEKNNMAALDDLFYDGNPGNDLY